MQAINADNVRNYLRQLKDVSRVSTGRDKTSRTKTCGKNVRRYRYLVSLILLYFCSAWSMIYGNLELPEVDKVQTIKELLCIKYGLISLPLLLDVSHDDFMLESLCTR